MSLTATLEKIEDYRTLSNVARRVPVSFNQPGLVVVRVSSTIGKKEGWLRAGKLAQCLQNLPGNPKKSVNQIFFDDAVFVFDGAGYPYFFEFWPYKWLTDYRLEIWVQLPKNQAQTPIE